MVLNNCWTRKLLVYKCKKKFILLCYVINYIIMENINFKILFWFQFTYTNEEQTTLKWWYKKFYKLRIGKIKKVSLNSCKHLTVNYIATRMILSLTIFMLRHHSKATLINTFKFWFIGKCHQGNLCTLRTDLKYL